MERTYIFSTLKPLLITEVAKWMNGLIDQRIILKDESGEIIRFKVTKLISVSVSHIGEDFFQAIVIVSLEYGESVG